MKKLILFFLAALCCKQACSQFSDSIHHYTAFNSSGTYNSTNATSYYLLNNGLALNVKRNKMSYNFVNKWLYGKQMNKLTNNDFNSTFDVNLYKTFKHFNYWAIFNFTSSYSLKIYSQFQPGVGVAYSFIDKKNAGLNVSYGIIYDYSNVIRKEDGMRQTYGSFRNSFRVKFRWAMGSRLLFAGSGFYQPSLQYGNDYIVKTDMSLAFKLKKWLSITAGFTYNEISHTGAQNLLMTYGLVLEKYFLRISEELPVIFNHSVVVTYIPFFFINIEPLRGSVLTA